MVISVVLINPPSKVADISEILTLLSPCSEAETEASVEGGVDWNTGGRVVT